MKRDAMFRPRMLPPIWLAVIGAAMWGIDHWFPITAIVPHTWRWIGMPAAALGVAIALSAERHMARTRTPVLPGRTPTTLVQSGAFARTRNPIYLGMVLVLIGWWLWLGSLGAVLALPAFLVIIRLRFIDKEERLLSETFGASFGEYRSRVRRWL